MEFSFDVNQLFTDRVSVIEQRFGSGRSDHQDQIAEVVNELGKASAKAQKLTAPITSMSKLQSQKHQLFLLKDDEDRRRPVILGFLKVGYKKLFLLDRHGVHVEAEPLCVLDFYIAESLQRSGYGLELFEFMLQHKHMDPVLMAYDRPSPKLLSFLSKHFSLTQTVPQVNNFVVFEDFFLNKSAAPVRKVPTKKADGEIKPYSSMEREEFHQERRSLPWPFELPRSPHRSISSKCPHSDSSRGLSPQESPSSSPRGPRSQSPLMDTCRVRRTSQQGLAARCSLYSRHMDRRAVGLLLTHTTDCKPAVDGPRVEDHSNCTSKPLRLPLLYAESNVIGCSSPRRCRDPAACAARGPITALWVKNKQQSTKSRLW
uniref:Alpha-tubulin N-acetyltransferase 1 n=3 Tax=Gouania willdenowi TaxID=441366 RepID=A0A8C5DCX2_GOUWI